MEQLANKLSSKIASELSYSDEKREVIEYGLIAIIQTIVTITLTLLFGAFFGVLREAAVISAAVSLLRKYSGGAHASSMLSCSIVGITVSLILALAAGTLSALYDNNTGYIAAGIAVYIFALPVAFIKAPVDSPAKPIRTNKKKIRMKKATLTILGIYIIITAIMLFYRSGIPAATGLYISLLLSVLWQIGSLTKTGAFILEHYDALVYKIINWKGGLYHEKD